MAFQLYQFEKTISKVKKLKQNNIEEFNDSFYTC